jgi:NitT/TauT family transport system substrate-binding protein
MLTSCKKDSISDDKITIGFMPSLAAVPYIYALEEGFYDELGMEVEFKFFQNADLRDAALIGESLDGVSTDLVMVGKNIENNIDMVITVKTDEEFRLVTSKDYQATSLSETNNARVAISEYTVIDYLVDQVAEKSGVNYTKIGIPSPVARKAALDSLNQDEKIDMTIMPEPFPSIVVNEGGKELWTNNEDKIFITCLAFRKNFVNENSEALKQFHILTDQAITELKTKNYDDYKNYIIKYDLLDESMIDIGERQEYTNLVKPNEAQFNDVITWMKAKDLITKDYKLDDLYFDWEN